MRIHYISINPIQISLWLMVVLVFFLSACSQVNTKGNSTSQQSSSESQVVTNIDPYEGFNRAIYDINTDLDESLLKLFAKAYKTVTPEVVDDSITNFFLNLEDITTAFNNLLQLKPREALVDTERFFVNTTLGIGGLFDAATKMGLEKHDEDFGQTLAHWGVPSGPYIMLPLMGPSTLRDATAKFSIDGLTNPTSYSAKSVYFFTAKNLDKRADLLSIEDAFKNISDDSYIAVRDAWLQRRDYRIRDGKVDEKVEIDLIDELESLDDQ